MKAQRRPEHEAADAEIDGRGGADAGAHPVAAACALPEAILELYGQRGDVASEQFASAAAALEEFIEQLTLFPTPWGLKWIVEARGVMRASFAQPVTEHRAEQSRAMAAWFAGRYPALISSE